MDEEDEQALREIEEARARFDRTVDKITNHTYHAIGSAITLWSEMEGMLVQMASCGASRGCSLLSRVC
jgi:RNA 3'-terminal phosphate cyclase